MNFHNRQYDPQIGRFLGVDPLAAATGNMSSYAGMNNNPANVVDPLGLMGEMITQDILVENGEDWRLAYNVYKGPSPGREDDIDERTGTGMYAVMLRYAEFMMEVEKQREAGGMTIDQMVDEAKNNPDKTVYFEKGRLVYVSSGIMLEDLEVRDGRADYAGWGKRMDKRFGQSLGWDFGGYGLQSNGGSNDRWMATDIMGTIGNGTMVIDGAFNFVENSKTGRFLANGYQHISKAEMAATMKLAKPLTKSIAVVNVLATATAVANDIDNGRFKSAGARTAVWGVAAGAAFIPVVGWGLSIGIGVADAIWGDDFYNYVENNW
jgi:hypothetical protein